MDSSFLTFSPKLNSRNKLPANIIQRPVRPIFSKSKLLPVKDTSNSPSVPNKDKNLGVFDRNNSRSERNELDDSIVVICEKKCERPAMKHSPSILEVSGSKFQSSEQLRCELTSHYVREKELQYSEINKCDEIRNWLGGLPPNHEKKLIYSPQAVKSTSNSEYSQYGCGSSPRMIRKCGQEITERDSSASVISCSLNNSNFLERPKGKFRSSKVIPDSCDDESGKHSSQKSFSVSSDDSLNKLGNNIHKSEVGSSDRSVKPVRQIRRIVFSDSESNGSLSKKSQSSASGNNTEDFSPKKSNTSHGRNLPRNIKKTSEKCATESNHSSSSDAFLNKLGDNVNKRGMGNSYRSVKPVRQTRRIVSSDCESNGSLSKNSQSSACENNTKDVSSKKSINISPGRTLSRNIKKPSRKCASESNHSSESISSECSIERIISGVYDGKWNKENVLTPVMQKKNVISKATEKDVAPVDDLLTHLYGDSWNKKNVLTPHVQRKKITKVDGKENTPPIKKGTPIFTGGKENPHPGKRINVEKPNFKLPGINSCNSKNMLGSNCDLRNWKYQYSFLHSLSASTSPSKCDPKALLFRKNFKQNKVILCSELLNLFITDVFENKIPATLKVEWNPRMTRTAGFCRLRWILGSEGKVRSAAIELSSKVCSTADRVRDTLIHELCHAAAWIVDGHKGHGSQWRVWATKAMKKFPELPAIKRCHNYGIETKYTYKCKRCGYSFGRHSKSLDLQRKRCGKCYGEFELLVNTKTKNGTTPRTPSNATGFALYVKENYKTSKEKNSGLTHKEIMKLLGAQFSGMKVTSDH